MPNRLCGILSASEMTYIVLGGALNSSHSLICGISILEAREMR